MGVVKVVREAYPDETQFDKADPHYDPKSTRENPRWDVVDIQLVRKTKRLISLREIQAAQLDGMYRFLLINILGIRNLLFMHSTQLHGSLYFYI